MLLLDLLDVACTVISCKTVSQYCEQHSELAEAKIQNTSIIQKPLTIPDIPASPSP